MPSMKENIATRAYMIKLWLILDFLDSLSLF